MQEALLRTYRYTSTIREPEAFRPWLHRTVRNACLMNRRRRAQEPKRLESLEHPPRDGADAARFDPPDPGRNPEQLAADAGLRTRLRGALNDLPPSYRAIVFLREMQGLSTRDVAHAMGISEDNVKTRLRRAAQGASDVAQGTDAMTRAPQPGKAPCQQGDDLWRYLEASCLPLVRVPWPCTCARARRASLARAACARCSRHAARPAASGYRRTCVLGPAPACVRSFVPDDADVCGLRVRDLVTVLGSARFALGPFPEALARYPLLARSPFRTALERDPRSARRL